MPTYVIAHFQRKFYLKAEENFFPDFVPKTFSLNEARRKNTMFLQTY